jgi:hypothetical protein
MLLENKHTPLIESETTKTTTVTFTYYDIEVLMEALSFAKSVYANSAKSKKYSEHVEDRNIAQNHEYSSLLIEELIEKIVKDGRLADYGGVLQ